MTQHRGRRRDAALSDAAWYRVAARTLALAYFALALVLLWADLDAVAALARSLGPADAFLPVGVVVAAVGVCAVAWEAARPPTDGARAAKGWTMVDQGAAIAYYLAVWQGPVSELIYPDRKSTRELQTIKRH